VLSNRGARILIVDDEKPVRTLLCNYLASLGFETAQAGDAEEALAALVREPFQLVLSDIQMPGRNGVSLLAEIRRLHPDVAVLMLTGCLDVSTAVESMKTGAIDYVLKPFELARVGAAIEQALERQAERRVQADHMRELEQTVLRQTNELRSLLQHLNAASEHTLLALVAALDAREHETKAHSRRVAEYALHLARAMGMQGEALESTRRGAMLHDIGKIGVSDNILLKPAPLTDAEWAEIRRHPRIGSWILNGIESLRPASEVVLAHHERYDGLGYPQKLKGEEIPLGARLFAVADSLDAITSDRPYHRGRSFEMARNEIAANSGAQFDPRAVDVFLQTDPGVWKRIRERTLSETAPPLLSLPEMVLAPCRPNGF
jgi:response regulator RpfG family c-di-GMP phosphodiesterase